MPPESEFMREINDDIYYEPERTLRSAPAAVYLERKVDLDPDLFSSKDLILVPRVTKTAPTDKSQIDEEHSSYFPEISWMVSNQNRKLSNLMNFDQSESKISANSDNSAAEQIDQLKAIFNQDIIEITKLIEMSKNVLQGRSDDKFSNSLLALNVRDKTLTSSEGHNSILPPIKHQKNTVSRGFRARRSVREIADQVSRKIKQLKSDPVEYKLLQEKIDEYRCNKNKNRKIQSAPGRQEVTEKYSPELRLKLQSAWREKHESHRHYVLARKKKMDAALLARKKKALERKFEAAAVNQREKEQAGRFQIIQRKWFIMVVIASRIAIMQKSVTEARKMKAIQMKRNHAAVVIQRFYRNYRKRVMLRLMDISFKVIRPTFMKYLIKRRRAQKHKAADMIRTFFKEAHDTSKLMKIVKKYRYAVIKAQNFVISFLTIQRARLTVVLKYADSLENQWKAHQKKLLLKSQEDLKIDDKKKTGKRASIIKKDKKDLVFTIPNDEKIKAIQQDLSRRLKLFRSKAIEYNAQLDKYNYNRKKRLTQGADEPPPPKPVFKLLPSKESIFAIFTSIYEGRSK